MMEETFISGYCRALDSVRTVTVEIENGKFFADCSYGSCPYEGNCQIAQRIDRIAQHDVQ